MLYNWSIYVYIHIPTHHHIIKTLGVALSEPQRIKTTQNQIDIHTQELEHIQALLQRE